MVWLPDGEKISKIFWHDPRTWQTDGQTGRRTNTQTLHDSIDRACIASRGKNAWQHVIRTTIAKNRHFYVPRPKFFVCPGDAPVAITQNVAWMKRQFSACQTLRSMYPPTFNAFQLFEPQVQKIAVFTYRSPHFSPGDAPAIITQCVARMKRQFNACQIPRSMYPSIFNSFRVIRCLSQCVSPKNRCFYYIFVSPGKYPWGNHAKCCMDGKRIRCLQIVSLHVSI